jgi:hypothetical protein
MLPCFAILCIGVKPHLVNYPRNVLQKGIEDRGCGHKDSSKRNQSFNPVDEIVDSADKGILGAIPLGE